jgi:hypothetical protein
MKLEESSLQQPDKGTSIRKRRAALCVSLVRARVFVGKVGIDTIIIGRARISAIPNPKKSANRRSSLFSGKTGINAALLKKRLRELEHFALKFFGQPLQQIY